MKLISIKFVTGIGILIWKEIFLSSIYKKNSQWGKQFATSFMRILNNIGARWETELTVMKSKK